MALFNTCTTPMAGKLNSASTPMAFLLKSSMMLNVLNLLPCTNESLMKSMGHVMFGPSGSTKGSLTRLGTLFLVFLLKFRPSIRYTRLTRFLFHLWPSSLIH
ncbi:MAG: hypothetical protein ABGX00_12625 [Allomuricauda sp.]